MPFLLSILSVFPVWAGDYSVAGALVRENTVVPGQSAEGTILVRNNGDEPQELIVYRRDYRFHSDGTNEYLEPATTDRSNAAWIDFTPSQLTVEPHVTERVHYRVDVPLDPALGGTYWSLLMIEPAAAEPLEIAPTTRTVSIQTIVRYAIQIVTHVGAPEPGLLAFDRGEIDPSDGSERPPRRMSIDIRNAGTSLLAPRVWVELFDAQGGKAGRFEARSKPGLFPGCSSRYAVDLASVVPGTYTALAVADAGMNSVFGAEYPLELR